MESKRQQVSSTYIEKSISLNHLLNFDFTLDQLMLDTMKKSQMMEDTREAELLRQQEAFINQNRMHIEKRRRSREYSPERDHRDRDRSRSFSPPRRRERDARMKPYSNFRDNRARRAGSNDRSDIFDPKRRRSDGDGNPDKNNPKVCIESFMLIIL